MPLEKSSPYAVPNVFPVSIPKPPQTNSSLAHLTSSNTSQTVNATKTPSDSLRPLSYIPSWYQTLSSQCNNPSLIRNLDVAATLSARSNATSIYDPLSSTAKPSVPPKNTDGDTPPQRSKPKSWSNEEDTLLIKLRSMGLSWTEVAKHFPGKSRKACSSRFDRISLETNMLANAQMNPNCSAFDSSATKPVSKMASSQTIQSANTGFNKIKISKTQTRSVMSKYESQIRTGSQPKQPPSTKLTNPTLPQMPSLNAVTGNPIAQQEMTAHGNSGHQLSNPHISSSQSTSSSVKLTSRPRPKTVVNPSVNTNSTSKAATKRNIDGASSINRSKNPNLRELANSTAGRPKTSTSTRIQNSMTSNPCPPNPSVAGSASPVTLMQSMAMPMFSSEFTDAMSKLMSDPIYRMAVMYGYMMGSAPQQPSTPSINLFNPMNMFPQIPLMSTNDKPSIQQKASEDDTNDEILTANSCLDEECISTNPGSLDDIMNQSEEYIDAMESYSAYTDSQKLSHSTDLYSSVLGPNKGKAKVSANSQFQSPSTGNTPKGQLSDEDEEEILPAGDSPNSNTIEDLLAMNHQTAKVKTNANQSSHITRSKTIDSSTVLQLDDSSSSLSTPVKENFGCIDLDNDYYASFDDMTFSGNLSPKSEGEEIETYQTFIKNLGLELEEDDDCGEYTDDDDEMDENKIDNSIIVPRDELEGLVEEECENGDGLLPSCSYQFPFSLTQLDEIRSQMEQNFQIVAQNYSLSKDVYGGESHSTRHWQSQLQEIVGQKDAALQEGFVASFFNLPGLTVVDWITEYEVEGNTRVEFFANRFNDHMKGSGSKERVKVDKKRKAKDFLKLTIRSQDILRGLGSILDSELLPQIVKEKRNERFFFTDDLDNLLNIGLRYLGSSYDTIHSICVPAVSATQLSRRFGSLSLRKASANVIKDFSLLQVKPLTVFESHTLAEAVQLFGRNFDYIARCILVERTSKFLELAYNQMERFGFSVHGAPPPTAQSVSLPILNTNATNIVDMLPPPHQVEELLSLDLNSADISLLDSFPLVDPSEAISDAPVKAHDGIIVDVGAGWNIPDLEALMNMDVFDNTLLDTSLQVPLTVPPSIDDIDWTAFLKDAELAASELPQPSQPVSKSQAPTPLILSPRKQNVITRVPEISFGGDKLSRNNSLKPKSSSKPSNKENVGKTSSFSHRRSSITKRKRDSIPSSNGTKKRRLFRPPTLHRTSSSVL